MACRSNLLRTSGIAQRSFAHRVGHVGHSSTAIAAAKWQHERWARLMAASTDAAGANACLFTRLLQACACMTLFTTCMGQHVVIRSCSVKAQEGLVGLSLAQPLLCT
jgi:hypothetical protein